MVIVNDSIHNAKRELLLRHKKDLFRFWFLQIESVLNILEHFVADIFCLIGEDVQLIHQVVDVFLAECLVNLFFERVEDVGSCALGVALVTRFTGHELRGKKNYFL